MGDMHVDLNMEEHLGTCAVQIGHASVCIFRASAGTLQSTNVPYHMYAPF